MATRKADDAGATTVPVHAADDAADVYIAAAELDVAHDPAPQTRRCHLPPITLARPVGFERLPRGLAAFPTSLSFGASAAGNEHTPPPSEQQTAQESIVVLSRAQVDAVEQYRWAAFFIFLLYVMTFFAWPSYIMSAFGLLTGVVGYGSCRMTQQGSRNNLAWVIFFIACNYVMMVFLVWVFVSLFVRDLQRASDGRPAMVLLAVFVVIGLLLHARAQRVARDFLAEFRAGVTRVPRPRRSSITIVRPRRSLFVHDASSVARPVGTGLAQAA